MGRTRLCDRFRPVDWSLFFGELVSGLTLGSIYALIALGYTMVYGILKLLNFAHGDVYMVGAFVGFFVLQWLGGPVDTVVNGWVAIAIRCPDLESSVAKRANWMTSPRPCSVSSTSRLPSGGSPFQRG